MRIVSDIPALRRAVAEVGPVAFVPTMGIVQGMVRQLDLPITVSAGETVRETDGLVMSSRNSYLSVAERTKASQLYRALQQVRQGMAPGDAMRELAAAGWQPDYIEVRSRK